jgi:hypothetical protein
MKAADISTPGQGICGTGGRRRLTHSRIVKKMRRRIPVHRRVRGGLWLATPSSIQPNKSWKLAGQGKACHLAAAPSAATSYIITLCSRWSLLRLYIRQAALVSQRRRTTTYSASSSVPGREYFALSGAPQLCPKGSPTPRCSAWRGLPRAPKHGRAMEGMARDLRLRSS